MFQLLYFYNICGKFFEFGVLHKGLPHHFLDIDVLTIVQIQDDLIGDFEFRYQLLSGIVHHPNHLL